MAGTSATAGNARLRRAGFVSASVSFESSAGLVSVTPEV
jgi:hypothetical protein